MQINNYNVYRVVMIPEERFPDALREVIASSGLSEGQISERIRSLDEETKRVALNWLNNHSAVLESSSRLRSVKEIMREAVPASLLQYVFETFSFSRYLPDPIAPLKRWVENPIDLDESAIEMFHRKSNFTSAFSFLLDSHECGTLQWKAFMQLFQTEAVFLAFINNFQEALLLFQDRLSLDQQCQLFKMQGQYGMTPLHNGRCLKAILALPEERLSSSQLVELLKTQNVLGDTPLHDKGCLKAILALPERRLSFDQLLQLLNRHNMFGKTPLSPGESLEEALDFQVDRLSSDQIVHLLKAMRQYTPSRAWLTKEKTIVTQETLSVGDYEVRANVLKAQVLSLWQSLSFGGEEGQVPSMFLSFDSKNFTKDEVQRALEVILDRIVKKTPWVGTPPAGNLQALHAFYTPMLLNFEKILEKLQEKGIPNETAAALFDLAKIELEGRCAAAYQGEIEQAAAVILGDNTSLSTDALLEARVKNTLINAIEKLLQGIHSTNVHDYNQLAHAAGLLPIPDPLSHQPVNHCRKALEEKWTTSFILLSLAESFRKIPQELLFDWFKHKTEEAFGPSYLALKEKIKFQEEEILSSTTTSLLKRGINARDAAKALEFFSSSRGAFLTLGKTLIEKDQEVKEALAKTIGQFSESDLLDSILEEELSHLKEQGWQETLNSIRKALAIPLSHAWQKAVQAFIEPLENAKQLKNEPFMQGLSEEQKRAILEEKQRFDSQMKALAGKISEEEEGAVLSINLKEHGLASQGIENSRKTAFASSFFQEEEGLPLSMGGIAFAAQKIGVLDPSQ